MTKFIGAILLILAICSGVFLVWANIKESFDWNNTVMSNWSLADKSSTLEAKADYMDKFVTALQGSELADNDALIYKTADNSCPNNIKAVVTLRERLNQIKGMDESSFQYQQAIQQITSQEQGQADVLLDTLHGCWQKTHYYYLWNPFLSIGEVFGTILLLVLSFIFFAI